jgi:hypothetical protein
MNFLFDFFLVVAEVTQEKTDGEDHSEVHRYFQQVWSWTFPDHRGEENLHGKLDQPNLLQFISSNIL